MVWLRRLGEVRLPISETVSLDDAQLQLTLMQFKCLRHKRNEVFSPSLYLPLALSALCWAKFLGKCAEEINKTLKRLPLPGTKQTLATFLPAPLSARASTPGKSHVTERRCSRCDNDKEAYKDLRRRLQQAETWTRVEGGLGRGAAR